MYPPQKNFSTDLAFLREWFLWRLGGGRSPFAPPLAMPLQSGTVQVICPELRKNALLISQSYLSNFALYMIKSVIYCNFELDNLLITS
jgi:hypothetical protein